MAPQRKYAFLVTVFMCTWLGCHRAPVIPIENQPTRPMPLDGKQWLAWQNSNREDFVSAYIGGYFFGVEDACNVHDDLEPTISLKHAVHCRAKAPRYSFKSDSAGNPDLSKYTNVLTKFYTEHPEYQPISYVQLMQYLTDEQHKTADDLYKMARSGQIRTSGGGFGSGTSGE
jgi:hypothetical protein